MRSIPVWFLLLSLVLFGATVGCTSKTPTNGAAEGVTVKAEKGKGGHAGAMREDVQLPKMNK